MRTWLKWLLGIVGALLLLALLAAGGGYLWLRGSLPQLNGRAAVAGLTAPVEVWRDANGLVTIKAQDESDAYRALGFVHAQDRLAQMDLMRRVGAGRLSEVLGEPTIVHDRFMRTLGFYRLAEQQLDYLSPATLATLEAYAEGVNGFLAERSGPLPVEFQLLGYEPEPWRPADSLVWGRLMALQLSGNWPSEALRLRLAPRLSREEIDFLWTPYPADAPTAIKVWTPGPTGRPLLPGEVVPPDWSPKDASNSWVVSGADTLSGKPILANDLHLSLNLPSQWYLARIEAPDLVLAGATAPGVPFMVAGRNGHLAWAFTTTHSDTQDLFIERLSKDAPGSYDTPEGPRPFELREETVEIRGQPPRRFTVRETRHGPVISDVRDELGETLPDGQVLALAWPALRADDRTPDAINGFNHARDWPQFLEAARNFHSPQQNLLVATTAGTIGFIAPARVPIRRGGDGRTPVAGWTDEGAWTGMIPFEELPQTTAPPDGRIVVANNKIVPEDYPHLIAADWPSPHRARRIEQLLDEGTAKGAEAELSQHAVWQNDAVSLAAAKLLPLLLESEAGGSEAARRARALLAGWDYSMARDRPEPLIYYAWLRELNRELLGERLGEDFPSFQRADADLLAAILSDRRDWCEEASAAPGDGCDVQVARALDAALAELEGRFGGNMEGWRWGDAHVARFRPSILGRIPVIGGFLMRSLGTDGGEDTVNRGGAVLAGPPETAFEHRHGATYRAVYDLADLDRSLYMITGGQSGNPLSPFYWNLAEDWRDGIYLTLDGRESEAVDRLLLEPR